MSYYKVTNNLLAVALVIWVIGVRFSASLSPLPEPVVEIKESAATAKLKPSICSCIKPSHKNQNILISRFLLKFRAVESSSNWRVVNRFGYMGYYQFGSLALQDVGLNFNLIDFKQKPQQVFPPHLQDKAMKKLLRLNRKRLKSYILRYHNRSFQGHCLTGSGLLAAAHLVGAQAVARWLEGGELPRDGNGTTVLNYIRKFYYPELDVFQI